MAKATVNLSDMTDEEVEAWRSRLEAAFYTEKRTLTGRRVHAIEWTRRVLKKCDDRNRGPLVARSATSNMIKKTLDLYEAVYSRVQVWLDKLRLHFLGIKV